MLILVVLEWLSGRAHAAVVIAPRLTVVVFSAKHVPDDEWTALSADLLRGFANVAMETHLDSGGVEVIRGDTLAPGTQFETVISVYLHGECRLVGQPDRYIVHGTLGWVLRDRGQIPPYIHVDCARIAEMLGQHAFGLKEGTRNAMMAEAISRVVLHEWLHVSTQSASHAQEGIFKPSFSVTDLIPDYKPGPGQTARGK